MKIARQRQLNTEHVGSSKQHKEVRTMKGMRKYLALLMAAIMVFSMVACDSDTGSESQGSSNRNDEQTVTQVAEEKPTAEDPKPDVEEPEVTQPDKPDPEEKDPEPVVEDNPNIIEDVDFTAFNEDGDREKLAEILNTMDLDGLRLIVLKYSHEAKIELVDDVLEDGESYGCDKPAEYYVFALYQPKEIQNIAVDEANMGYAHNVHNGYKYGRVYYIIISNLDILTADGYDMSVTATYSDGSEETITVTLYAK